MVGTRRFCTHRRQRWVAVAKGIAGPALPGRRGGRLAYGHTLAAGRQIGAARPNSTKRRPPTVGRS
jgi:hypothetical protein